MIMLLICFQEAGSLSLTVNPDSDPVQVIIIFNNLRSCMHGHGADIITKWHAAACDVCS